MTRTRLTKDLVGLISHIQVQVAIFSELSVRELVSRARPVRVAWPRAVSMYLARRLTGAPYAWIGAVHGGRTRHAARHAMRVVRDMMDTNEFAKSGVEKLEAKLKGGGV